MDETVPLIISSLLCGDPLDARRSNAVAVRLATTCREDSPSAIAAAVEELIRQFHHHNDAGPGAVRLVIFTATPDLRSAKPAAAARAAGWTHAQYLCLAEMPTDDDLPFCLRALLIVDRGVGANQLKPIYLNGAQSLRPDFALD